MPNDRRIRRIGFVIWHSDFIRPSLSPILPLAIKADTKPYSPRCRDSCSVFRASVFYDDSDFSIPRCGNFAPWLRRWLSARACDSREVISRHDEAEFPMASQSALFEWALDDWRAADGVPIAFGALRPFNNWTKRKDHHELLFNWETLAPFARRLPTPWQQPFASSARRSEGAKKDILATDCRIFWKWRNEGRNNRAQWHASLRDQHANLNGLKLLRRVCMSVTCLSTQPRAIFLNCSTA